MTDYREVLRLRSLGFNNSQIATSMGLSRPTVIGIVQRSMSQGLDWQTAEGLSDRELSEKIFPSESEKPGYKMPDYDWVHREMAKPGVTLQLLWFELKNGRPFGRDYFDELLERIREIRASERRAYQKIADVFEQCSYLKGEADKDEP